MIVLGLDLGTRMGWAVLDGERRIDSGTSDLSLSEWEGVGMRAFRARRRMLWLLGTFHPEMVAIERVRRHKGTEAGHVYGGLRDVVTECCEGAGVPYTFVEVAAVKQAATGKGNAGKPAMLAAARERWGEVGDDNEADALWCAVAAQVRERLEAT